MLKLKAGKIHNHELRFSEMFFLPRVNSYYGLKPLFYLGCKVWDEMAKNLKKNYLS